MTKKADKAGKAEKVPQKARVKIRKCKGMTTVKCPDCSWTGACSKRNASRSLGRHISKCEKERQKAIDYKNAMKGKHRVKFPLEHHCR